MVKLGYEVNISNELVDDNHRQGGFFKDIKAKSKEKREKEQQYIKALGEHEKATGLNLAKAENKGKLKEFNDSYMSRQGAIADVKGQIMLANQQAQQQQAQQQAKQAQISNIRAEQVAQDLPVMNKQGQQIDVLTQSLKDSQEDNQQLQSQLQEVSEQAQSYQQQAQQAANVINTATVLGNMQAQNPDSPVILAAANAADSQQGE